MSDGQKWYSEHISKIYNSLCEDAKHAVRCLSDLEDLLYLEGLLREVNSDFTLFLKDDEQGAVSVCDVDFSTLFIGNLSNIGQYSGNTSVFSDISPVEVVYSEPQISTSTFTENSEVQKQPAVKDLSVNKGAVKVDLFALSGLSFDSEDTSVAVSGGSGAVLGDSATDTPPEFLDALLSGGTRGVDSEDEEELEESEELSIDNSDLLDDTAFEESDEYEEEDEEVEELVEDRVEDYDEELEVNLDDSEDLEDSELVQDRVEDDDEELLIEDAEGGLIEDRVEDDGDEELLLDESIEEVEELVEDRVEEDDTEELLLDESDDELIEDRVEEDGDEPEEDDDEEFEQLDKLVEDRVEDDGEEDQNGVLIEDDLEIVDDTPDEDDDELEEPLDDDSDELVEDRVEDTDDELEEGTFTDNDTELLEDRVEDDDIEDFSSEEPIVMPCTQIDDFDIRDNGVKGAGSDYKAKFERDRRMSKRRLLDGFPDDDIAFQVPTSQSPAEEVGTFSTSSTISPTTDYTGLGEEKKTADDVLADNLIKIDSKLEKGVKVLGKGIKAMFTK